MLIAVIGDIHSLWSEADTRWFDASDYDLLLFVGDFASYAKDGTDVARQIARLRKPALVMPGNHDGVRLSHLAAEVFALPRLARFLGRDQDAHCRRFERALGAVPMAGYSCSDMTIDGVGVSVISGRPHSMGGSRWHFAEHMRRRHGVEGFADSAERLCRLVSDSRHHDIVFFAHNGPTGLGQRRSDIWGCDFKPQQGDYGDADLRSAIDHARAIGKRVRAVVAGHMHHRLNGGGWRRWQLEVDGIQYVNAAHVPRIGRRGRHHVRLQLDGDAVTVEERFVERSP